MNIKPQFIRAGEEELVVLTRAEYDALLDAAADVEEEAADVAIYDARKAALARGEDFVLPPEVSALVLKGDSLLRAVRKWRDMTQTHLEFKTGIGQGYISDIEAGRRVGSAETLATLARALEVPVGWFVKVADAQVAGVSSLGPTGPAT